MSTQERIEHRDHTHLITHVDSAVQQAEAEGCNQSHCVLRAWIQKRVARSGWVVRRNTFQPFVVEGGRFQPARSESSSRALLLTP